MNGRAQQCRDRAIPGCSATVAMVCRDDAEAARVGQLLEGIGSGSLMTFRRTEDISSNAPRRAVSLVVMTGMSDADITRDSLRKLRRSLPRVALAVIGETSSIELEIAVREAGAIFFVKPVTDEQWVAMLEHAIVRNGRRIVSQG